jgi:O-antigen/teichoic acid export membrane protein
MHENDEGQCDTMMLESREINTLASGATVALFGRLIGRGLNVLVLILLARFLGPIEFGLYALGWTIVQMGTLLAPLGLDKGVLQFGSRFYKRNSTTTSGIIFQSILFSLIVGLTMSAIIFFLAPLISKDVFNKPDLASVLRKLSPIFLLFAGIKVTAAATRVSQRVKYSIFVEDILPPLLNLLLFLGLFLIFGWKLHGALIAVSISFIVAFLLAIFYVTRLFPETFSLKSTALTFTKDLISFSLSTSLTGIFSMFIIWTNRLIVGYFLPEADIGIYQVVSQLSLLIPIIMSGFSAIFAPMIADLHHRRKYSKLQEIYTISTKWGLYLGIPFILITVMMPMDLLLTIFGKPYTAGSNALIILMFGQFINLATGAVGWLLMMTGNQKQWLLITFSLFVVSMALGIVLTPRLGLEGAAIATSIGSGTTYLLGILYAWQRLGLHPYDRRYYKGILATIVTGIILIFFQRTLQLSPVLRITGAAILSVATFTLTWILVGIDREDVEFLTLIRGRIMNAMGGRVE